jgi:hypothetical protein
MDVDEFGLRKGRRCGTQLVDVETGRPVDILDHRLADSFAARLAAGPGAEVICRTETAERGRRADARQPPMVIVAGPSSI